MTCILSGNRLLIGFLLIMIFEGDENMSTRVSSAERQIRDICSFLQCDEEAVYRRGLQILERYNQIKQADGLVNQADSEEDYQEGSELQNAARDLRNFFIHSENTDDDLFWQCIYVLMDKKWMLDLADSAIIYIRNNQIDHQDYFHLIQYRFLDGYSEIDICDFTGLQRSAMYARRKEAVTLFGIGVLKALGDFMRYPARMEKGADRARTSGGQIQDTREI